MAKINLGGLTMSTNNITGVDQALHDALGERSYSPSTPGEQVEPVAGSFGTIQDPTGAVL